MRKWRIYEFVVWGRWEELSEGGGGGKVEYEELENEFSHL
jgi:hypothetical protein